MDKVMQATRHALRGPFDFDRRNGRWCVSAPEFAHFADNADPGRSYMRLFEDSLPLAPYARHDALKNGLKAAFSHWSEEIYLQTSDGSDPNRNGRTYWVELPDEEVIRYLDLHAKKRQLAFDDRPALWDLGSDPDFFKARGGDRIGPPIYCNMIGLTSHCNLRCTICGSQEAIDHEGIKRRSMRADIAESVADTIFPYVSVVILASLGEPLIYPYIGTVLDKMYEYGCSLKLESNGTALSEKRIQQLCRVKGELFFSIDATGELFNEMRVGADWKRVDANIRALMAIRNPLLTKVNTYPTVSRKTLPDMINVVKWSLDVGIQELTFHSYDPTLLRREERPTEEEYLPEIERIQNWLTAEVGLQERRKISIKVNGNEINEDYEAELFYSPKGLPMNNPIRKELYPTREYICSVPLQHVEIGLDGQIYPCVWSGARPQDNTMGLAVSNRDFANAWFGPRYRQIRESLKVGSNTPKGLAQCDGCIKRYEHLGSMTYSD